jgi:hypothetical protein
MKSQDNSETSCKFIYFLKRLQIILHNYETGYRTPSEAGPLKM